MRGNITRRGKHSWRLKLEVTSDAPGKRKIHYETIKGRRQDAERRLTQLLAQVDAGMLVEPSKVTVAEYLRAWLGHAPSTGEHLAPPAGLANKTCERFRELAEGQIIPHLGTIACRSSGRPNW